MNFPQEIWAKVTEVHGFPKWVSFESEVWSDKAWWCFIRCDFDKGFPYQIVSKIDFGYDEIIFWHYANTPTACLVNVLSGTTAPGTEMPSSGIPFQKVTSEQNHFVYSVPQEFRQPPFTNQNIFKDKQYLRTKTFRLPNHMKHQVHNRVYLLVLDSDSFSE